jgi:predicted transcriptional regulator of viral defense system
LAKVTICATIDDVTMPTTDRETVRAPQAADWAIGHGIGAITTGELAKLMGVPAGQVRQRLAAPVRRSEWVALGRGLWAPVAPQYRLQGGPPGNELIGELAKHLGFDYYVGWLSAAAIHGAAHHASQVFQVAVSREVAGRKAGRIRMEFHRRERVGIAPTRSVRGYGGDVPYSTPAVTALDVANDLKAAAGLDNAATVIVDLHEEAGLTGDQVAEVSESYPVAAVRRVGWVLEVFAGAGHLDRLRAAAKVGAVPPATLDPAYPRRGKTDRRWALCLNTDVEPDL